MLAPRILAVVLCTALLLPVAGGCTEAPQRYEMTYLSLFDTVVTIVLYAEGETEAQEMFRAVYDLSLIHI